MHSTLARFDSVSENRKSCLFFVVFLGSSNSEKNYLKLGYDHFLHFSSLTNPGVHKSQSPGRLGDYILYGGA